MLGISRYNKATGERRIPLSVVKELDMICRGVDAEQKRILFEQLGMMVERAFPWISINDLAPGLKAEGLFLEAVVYRDIPKEEIREQLLRLDPFSADYFQWEKKVQAAAKILLDYPYRPGRKPSTAEEKQAETLFPRVICEEDIQQENPDLIDMYPLRGVDFRSRTQVAEDNRQWNIMIRQRLKPERYVMPWDSI